MATPARLERATHRLEVCCSIQLSYGVKWWTRQDSNLRPNRYERPALTTELQVRRPGRTRTDTVRILSPLPLPIGLRALTQFQLLHPANFGIR